MFDPCNDQSKYDSYSTQFCIMYTFEVSIPISFVNTFEANGFSTLNLFGLNMNRNVVNLSYEFITNFYI